MNRRRFVQSTLASAVAASLPASQSLAAILSGSMGVDADVNAITGDGAEVTLGTNPLDPDTDADGFCDGPSGAGCTPGDNCPLIASANQTNSDSLPAGNICQCGDPNNDGFIDFQDVGCFGNCFVGNPLPPNCVCGGPKADANGDGNIDFQDVGGAGNAFVGFLTTSQLNCAARPTGSPGFNGVPPPPALSGP